MGRTVAATPRAEQANTRGAAFEWQQAAGKRKLE
jgi:hypothetical protein